MSKVYECEPFFEVDTSRPCYCLVDPFVKNIV